MISSTISVVVFVNVYLSDPVNNRTKYFEERVNAYSIDHDPMK